MKFPLRLYYNQNQLDKEWGIWFQKYGGFIGFSSLVPNEGDYYVVPHTNESKVLIRNDNELVLLNNFCRHRQAQLLFGSGNIKSHHITCPIHRWSYDLEGNLTVAHGFKPLPILTIKEPNIYEHNGLLATDNKIFESFKTMKPLNIDGFNADEYKLVSSCVIDYKINWKEYMDVFFDNYHVQTYHPGLRAIVNVKNLEWEFGDNYIVQKVGWNKNFYKRPGSPKFERYANELKATYGEKKWEYGAIWLSIFPNIIIEKLQDFLLTAIAIPISSCKTQMFFSTYAHKSIIDNQPLWNAFNDAMDETEEEDGEILESICKGRYQLWMTGHEDQGPYHHPTEVGMRHFHEYVLRYMDEPIEE